MSEELKVAIEAAKEGGKHALKHYDKDLTVELKDDNTPVTVADKESEEVIKNHILKSFPNAKFVGEESGGSVDEDEFWTIDPIDGTRSFNRGIPQWCTLISLCKKEGPVIGVCYYPINNQLMYAERGHGAYLNGEKIHVSKINSFSNALLGYGNPRYVKNKKSLLRIIELAGSSRSWEATYSIFLLTQGKVDAFYDGYGFVWDVAPFKVIVEEAGGKITRPDGSTWSYKGRGCVATNGLLHDEVIKLINN